MTRGGSRPGAGRPPTRDETARQSIQMRVTDAEKRTLSEAAVRAGQSLSSWLLEMALDAATR